MKKLGSILALMMAVFAFAGCEKLEELPLSEQNTLSSFKYIVYTNDANKTVKEYAVAIPSNGLINIDPVDTREDLKNVRMEAIIPATARIVEKDAAENIVGAGVGGQRDVYKKIYYFYVVAANGAERKYTVRFR